MDNSTEAYRMVFTDGYKSYWHTFDPFIDLMMAGAADTDRFYLESREFASEDEVDRANDQHGLT